MRVCRPAAPSWWGKGRNDGQDPPPGRIPLCCRRDDVTAEDVVLSELLNRRGPVGWLAASSTCIASAAALTRLAADCGAGGSVLVLLANQRRARSAVDLVLVPREAAARDGVPFAVFATRVSCTCGEPVHLPSPQPRRPPRRS